MNTPTDASFEERAQEMAEKFQREPSTPYVVALSSAHWGRTEGIRECIEALRSQEADIYCRPQFDHDAMTVTSAEGMADWLASRKMKP